MILAWLTDIHLDHINSFQRERFLESLDPYLADAFLITGDIAESPDLIGSLQELEEAIQKPIYFVLGNHDFYQGSIAEIRSAVTKFAKQSKFLTYMTADTIVPLTTRTALIGHDCWADARCGDFQGSDVTLSDYVAIQELRVPKKTTLEMMLNVLGNEAAIHLDSMLEASASRFQHTISLTHAPPFKEASWHKGQNTNDNFLPHFVCKAVGDAMRDVMCAYPESDLHVLCGHTHSGGEAQIAHNLRVSSGAAEYGNPIIQRVWGIE
jgi:3',5'-cyclic AMP phosphodiesterase CpdA